MRFFQRATAYFFIGSLLLLIVMFLLQPLGVVDLGEVITRVIAFFMTADPIEKAVAGTALGFVILLEVVGLANAISMSPYYPSPEEYQELFDRAEKIAEEQRKKEKKEEEELLELISKVEDPELRKKLIEKFVKEKEEKAYKKGYDDGYDDGESSGFLSGYAAGK